MNLRKLSGIAAIIAIAWAGAARAQQPQPIMVPSIGPTDIIVTDLPGGIATPQTHGISALTLGNYGATQAGNNSENALIGGDFGTNLFQDGTSVSTITTTATYVADQWSAFSGTSTTIAGTQQTGASDIPADYAASLRITRSGAGILQSCVAQPLTSAATTRYQGQTAEVDFHALAGSGFSAASGNLNVILVQSTGNNQTMANLAKTVNSALSGTAWTGATLDTVAVPISTSWARNSVAFPVLATTTQMGVALCWTPVGASPSSDWFEFTGAQLVPNSALTALATGTTGVVLNTYQQGMAKSFARRQAQMEAALQYQFYWRQNEAATSTAGANAIFGTCQGTSTSTIANCNMQFPVPMFQVPTLSYTAGTIKATVGAAAAQEAVSALALATNGATVFGAQMAATSSSVASGAFGYLEAGNSTGGGSIIFNARL